MSYSHPPRWHADAACIGLGDVFFPSNDTDKDVATVAQAKAICATCPVAAECLQEALTTEHGAFGIWGGTTTVQRRRMRPKRSTCEDCAAALAAEAERQRFCDGCARARHKRAKAASLRRRSVA